MSTEGIVTIFLTLILGIPSIITIFRLRRTRIVYLEKHIINLNDDLLKNFNQLSIKYKGIEIQQNVFFISGFLVCQGDKDISNENSYVEIYIPNKSKWLDLKIVSNSKGMQIEESIFENKANITFDLFKNKEYIEYEGILEIDSKAENIDTKSLLEFHHRIPNIPSISKFKIENLKTSLSTLLLSSFIAFIPLFFAYNYYKLDYSEVKAYNATKNTRIDSFTLYENKQLSDLYDKTINENSGFTFLFEGKSKVYPINAIKDFRGMEKTDLTSVYFKMDEWMVKDYISAIFLIFVFLLSLILIIKSLTLYYYQKRYLTLINQ